MNNLTFKRITGAEMEEILQICGFTKYKFAEALGCHLSTVSRLSCELRDRPLSLKRIETLKNFVGEKMYEEALSEVRTKKSR